MKKILVPTDFSENAKYAFLYAMNLAEQLDAAVTVCHVYHPSANSMNEIVIPSDNELFEIRKERLNVFVNKSYSKNMDEVIVADMIDQKLEVGFASDKLVEMSKTREYDMIVMGATGSTGLLEKVFGKVSLSVAQRAACPVLLIPAGVRFYDINDIMYASEYESADGDLLIQLADFSNQLDANVHLVHVYNKDEIGPEGLGHYLLEKAFQLKAPTLKFKMDSITSDSVAHGLGAYARNKNMDLMVIVKPQRKFWQRLIHTSRTNEIIMNPEIPLMVMHLPQNV